MGVVGPDNFDYVTIAHSILRGSDLYARDDFFPYHIARLTMVLPLALSFGLFGPGERVSTLWPMLCSLGSVVVAFGIGRRVAGAVAGLAAAAVVAVHPLEVLYAGTPLPDTVVALFLGLAVWGFLAGLARSGRPAALAFFASGVAVGLAYYARVNALVVFGFFGLWLLWARRRPGREMLALPVGAGLVFLLGVLFVVSRGGPPWFELVQSLKLSAGHSTMLAARGGRDPLFHFGGMLVLAPLFRPWTLVAGAAALLLLVRRDRWLALPALWALVMYGYLEFLSQYPAVSLVQKEMRYLTPLVLPLGLTVGIAAARLWGLLRPAPVRAVGLVAAVVAIGWLTRPSLAVAANFAAYSRGLEARAPREAAAVLRELPPLPVYVTSDWVKYLNFFGRFAYGLDPADPSTAATARLRKARLDASGRPIEVGRGYVVHDESYGLAVPPDWVLVARAPPKTAIYYAPDPARPEAGRFEMRFLPDLAVAPGLSLVAAGVEREAEGESALVALDWLVSGELPRGRLSLRLGEGRPVGHDLVGPDSLPAGLWRAGGIYREYYALPRPTGGGWTELELAVGEAAPVRVGALAPPEGGASLEAEALEGVLPDQDRALGALTGWGSYSQPPYSGGKAAIARLAGARADGQVAALPPGPARVWLRVFSYGGAANRLEVEVNGRAVGLAYRSGAPGLGWVEAGLPEQPGGGAVALRVADLKQPFAIVDRVVVVPGER